MYLLPLYTRFHIDMGIYIRACLLVCVRACEEGGEAGKRGEHSYLL